MKTVVLFMGPKGQAKISTMLHGHYPRRRSYCRASLRIYTWIFAVLFFVSPFIVFGDSTNATPTSVFGLDPELVKLLLYGSILIMTWLLIRVLARIDRSQNILHQNDRELSRALTQLVTAHNINHGQVIDPPHMSGGSEEVGA